MCFHSPCRTPVTACNTIHLAKDPRELVLSLLFPLGLLQCSLRTGMAASVDGPVRGDDGHGFDRAVGVHGRTRIGGWGYRPVAAPPWRGASCPGAGSLCTDGTCARRLGA